MVDQELHEGDQVRIKGERGIKSTGKINKLPIDEKHPGHAEVMIDGKYRTLPIDRLEPATVLFFAKEGNKRRTRKRIK